MATPDEPKRKRICTIPILGVVFAQTFVVAVLVIAIPLSICLNSWRQSNAVSSTSGAAFLSTLANKIQTNEGSIALVQLQSVLTQVEGALNDMQLSFSNYVDMSNPQQIFDNLAQIQKYKGYSNNIFYGNAKNDFVGIINYNTLYAQLPLSNTSPNCVLCQYPTQFTPAQTTWATTRGSFSKANWNPKTLSYGNFTFLNTTYTPTKRVWYTQAQNQTMSKSSIQWTNPYMFQDGNTGITAAFPVFNKTDGSVIGVGGTDIQFASLQRALKSIQTNNTFIYIMTSTGTIIGTSSNEPLMKPDGTLKTVYDLTDPYISRTAMLMRQLLLPGQDFSMMGPLLSLFYYGVFFQVRVMEKAPHFVVVNGAPRSDFMGSLDEITAQLDASFNSKYPIAIGIAVGVFVVMVALGCVLTYYAITRPLRFIIEIILQGTTFDFSAFKEMSQKDGNLMTEFSFMESTFFKMIEKFADGLKSNKAAASNSNKKAASNNTFAKSGASAVSAASMASGVPKND
ncbi:hypothetical protein BDR26DRAFT_866877 [Obelidium mucronatum]|nr:hypothetical protein BDR26DRAFT_866877 [Obelidium mucronatum]